MPIFAIFATAVPEMLAVEAAAATAAEIAAAEAAAAAAAEAASIAAAEAAATAAAETAATTAATTAAQTAATAPQAAGIMEVGGATANTPLTAEAVQNAAMQSGQNFAQGLPQGFEQQLQNIQSMGQGPSVQVASTNPTAGLESIPGSTVAAPTAPASPPASLPMDFGPPVAEMTPADLAAQKALTTPSALETGMNKALEFAKENPFTAMTGAYTGAKMFGLLDPSKDTFNQDKYSGPLSKYRLSPDFQPGSANPVDFQYTPRRYAEGGIMGAGPVQAMSDQNSMQEYQRAMTATGGQVASFAKGGSLTDAIEQYQKMLSGKPMEAPAVSRDVGIYHDQDPDTRYQDPLTAAQIRQAKVNQRAYVSPPVAKRPTPMGQLQMASVKPRKQKDYDDVEAAKGGIMHSSLGGYASGGNPRLLKGPGDGMSDNIPATINGRQPARLADGEFVIPADVVSHLGNGSTEAGAKQLHAMMNRIRKARTGNPKQGKNINPSKYMPK